MSRDLIFIDRTLCDLGRPERMYRMKVTLTEAELIYGGKSAALTRYFQSPEFSDKLILMLFHIIKGFSLERRLICVDPKNLRKFKYRICRFYNGFQTKTSYQNILKRAIITDTASFLRNIERAHAITGIVLDKMRTKQKE